MRDERHDVLFGHVVNHVRPESQFMPAEAALCEAAIWIVRVPGRPHRQQFDVGPQRTPVPQEQSPIGKRKPRPCRAEQAGEACVVTVAERAQIDSRPRQQGKPPVSLTAFRDHRHRCYQSFVHFVVIAPVFRVARVAVLVIIHGRGQGCEVPGRSIQRSSQAHFNGRRWRDHPKA